MSTSAGVAESQPRRRISRQRRQEATTGLVFAAPFFILFCLVFLAPILVSIRASFFRFTSSGKGLYGGGELQETWVGLQNYAEAAGNPAFWQGMGRVILFGVFQIPIMIGLALTLALVLDSYLVRRVGFFRLSYFLPFAIPGLIAAMMWTYMYSPGLSPILAAFPEGFSFFHPKIILASMANITTWTYTGYNMLIFLAALQAIPTELYEAARIDGASGFKVTTKIKIPMVRNAALLAVLLSIIGTIQLFNEPVIMRSVNTWMRADYTPMMMAYNTMMGELTPSGDGPASAISILMALIAGVLAVVYALLQKKADL